MENPLTRAIASSLAEWGVPHVELAIFGTADASHIAAQFAGVCISALGSPPARSLFYRSSVGAVAGISILATALAACRKGYAKGHGILAHFSADAGQRAALVLRYMAPR